MVDVLGLDHAVHPWIAESDQRVRFGLGTLVWRAGGELLRLGQNAEHLGFDSYWVQDLPMGGPDCWTSLAALAVTTQRLRLGSIVSCVYYRSPVLLARHAADVDRFSGGRLVLGIGFGDQEDEFRQMNLPVPPVPERQAALEETVRIVRGLWTGKPYTFSGRHFSLQNATLPAGPVQQPYVPVLIAGGGERVTLRQVAEYGDMSNFGENVHTGLPVVVGESSTALEAKLEARFGAVPADRSALHQTSIVSGTPEDLIGYYHGLIDLGIRYFIAAIYADDNESRELLARRVMPEFA
jgi:alkanesulfonate monooxygenase SsuD/methylene tetrahydromethanopterin reductase-like flavin-dependent oxidoreductase (luciferase family)